MSELLPRYLAISVLCSAIITPPALSIQGSHFDRALADEARLIDMLKRSGKIADHASTAMQQDALNTYLLQHSENSQKYAKSHPFAYKIQGYRQQTLKKMNLSNYQGSKGTVSFLSLEPVQRTDKILALLIDFPDYPKNSIKPEQSEMYYANYSREHFQNLLFSPTGYLGPKGEHLISMNQYYQQQSRSTYSVTGQVKGWYTASKNAAYYGDNNHPTAVRELVREALTQLAQDPNFDWSEFDQEDRYDHNNNGNYREPDGMIDHLMIFHSSIGEEAGGGDLGENAIWSHRWNLGEVFKIPGTSHQLGTWNGQYAAFDYTIQPITAAAGVCAHEFGHDLGLPDEYDTSNTSQYGEPVSFWSIMSSGSWAGNIPGAEPVGFSGWARAFLQASIGGKWQNKTDLHLDHLTTKGRQITLWQASGQKNDTNAIRIDLPQKEVILEQPYDGQYHYHSGQDNDLHNKLSYRLNLPQAQEITFSFKANYQIETDYDYGRVTVNGNPIPGNITTMQDPNEVGFGIGFTGMSFGWTNAIFDLTAFAGQDIELAVEYMTDGGLAMKGLFVDELTVTADDETILFDNGEQSQNNTPSHMEGFYRTTGTIKKPHYYLLEWRNHHGVDQGLSHIIRYNQRIEFNPGLLIWYVDDSFQDNWVGQHPGEGFLGVIDADQVSTVFNRSEKTQEMAKTVFQMQDATFSRTRQKPVSLYTSLGTLTNYWLASSPVFKDWHSFYQIESGEAGRKLTPFGLRIEVKAQADDMEDAIIHISRKKISFPLRKSTP